MIEGDYGLFLKAIEDTFITIEQRKPDNLPTARKLFSEFYNKTRMTAICDDYFPGPYKQIQPNNIFIETDVCTTQQNNQGQSVFGKILEFLKSIFNFILRLFFN